MGSDPEQPCLSVEIRDKTGSVIKTIERSVGSSSGTFHQQLSVALKEVQQETNDALTKIIDNSKVSTNKSVTSEAGDQSGSEEDSSEPHKRAKNMPSPAKKKQKNHS